MAIIVKNKNIKEELVDESGNVLGYISYNPEDTTTYTKLCNIMDNILQISDKSKITGNIKKMPEHIEKIEEFAEFREDFQKMKDFFDFHDAKIDEIIKDIDSIFGEGTCKILMGDSKDIDLVSPLLDEVLPKFKEAREKKANKYLDNEKVEQLDVME